MNATKILLSPGLRRKLEAEARTTNDARYRVRCLSVLRGAEGKGQDITARELGCSPATVCKARRRFAAEGLAGLVDRREDNGELKADEPYAATLVRVLKGRPVDFGHSRPTWTKRLLITVMQSLTGVVLTPGKNVKRYFAAAMDATTGILTWVGGRRRKDSGLFIELLGKLKEAYTGKRMIHVILDNYTIHSSKRTRTWLAEQGAIFRLHFLPPYSPDDNRIERRLWREVHANVTVNHNAPDINTLCARVRGHMVKMNNNTRRESRAAI